MPQPGAALRDLPGILRWITQCLKYCPQAIDADMAADGPRILPVHGDSRFACKIGQTVHSESQATVEKGGMSFEAWP
jgi:hypothetical protein